MGRLRSTAARRAIPLVVGAGIVYYGVFAGEYGWLDLHEMRQERDRIVMITDSLRVEREAGEAAIDRLRNDPGAIERVARERYGMIRAGETLFRFVPLGDSAELPSGS